MDFFKTIAGRAITAVVLGCVVTAGLAFWQMDPAGRDAITTNTGRIISWFGVVLLLPFLTFFVISWVASFKSNGASAALVVVYTLGEGLLLGKLFKWSMQTTTAWTFFVVGIMLAGVYNLLVSDWLAEKME